MSYDHCKRLHVCATLSGGQTESMHFSSLFYLRFQLSSLHLPVRPGVSARRANGLELLSFETVLWFKNPPWVTCSALRLCWLLPHVFHTDWSPFTFSREMKQFKSKLFVSSVSDSFIVKIIIFFWSNFSIYLGIKIYIPDLVTSCL